MGRVKVQNGPVQTGPNYCPRLQNETPGCVGYVLIWMDTIEKGRFEDTNALFENPDKVDFHIKEWNDHNHQDVAEEILKSV